MDQENLEALRYPIGKFIVPETYNSEIREQSLQAIAQMPEKLIAATAGLEESQLTTPYREGGLSLIHISEPTRPY